MNAVHQKNDMFSRRFRSAFVVGVTSVSMTFASLDEINAGWLSLPSSKKADENVDQKSTSSSSESIRNLMTEAKSQEKLGNLEMAIKLADRAHRLADSASKMTKLSKDVSPAATSKLADDLRLKKTELSVKRTGAASQRGKMPVADSKESKTSKDLKASKDSKESKNLKESKSQSVAADKASSVPRKMAAVPETTASLEQRPSKTVSNSPLPAKAPNPKSASSVASKAVSKSPNLDIDVDPKPAASDQSKLNSALSKFLNDKKIESNVEAPEKRDSKKIAARADFDFNEDFSEISQPPILPSPTASSTTVQKLELNSLANSGQVKVRRSYVSCDNVDSIVLAVAEESLEEFEMESTDKTVSTTDAWSDESRESEHILTTSADEEISSRLKTPAKSTSDSRSPDKLDEFEQTQIEPSTQEFPVKKVLELKRRLDTATSLEPGAIRPSISKTVDEDQFLEKNPDEHRVVKLRKRSRKVNEIPVPASEPVATGVAHQSAQSVVVKTAMIQWRSAKETTSGQIPTTERRPAKSDAIIAHDLRRSVNESSPAARIELSAPMTSSEPASPKIKNRTVTVEMSRAASSLTVDSKSPDAGPSSQKLRGSLWDNATAPSANGFSGSVEGSAKVLEAPSVMLGIAPTPPADADVEQTSFDASDGLFDRYRRSQSNREPGLSTDRLEAPDSSTMPTAELPGTSSPEVGSRRPHSSKGIQPTANQAEKTRGELVNGPIERLALLLGVPVSNASSIVLAAGLTMLFAGLWMVRAAMSSKNN